MYSRSKPSEERRLHREGDRKNRRETFIEGAVPSSLQLVGNDEMDPVVRNCLSSFRDHEALRLVSFRTAARLEGGESKIIPGLSQA